MVGNGTRGSDHHGVLRFLDAHITPTDFRFISSVHPGLATKRPRRRESICSQKEQGLRQTLIERHMRTRSGATPATSMNSWCLRGCMWRVRVLLLISTLIIPGMLPRRPIAISRFNNPPIHRDAPIILRPAAHDPGYLRNADAPAGIAAEAPGPKCGADAAVLTQTGAAPEW